MSKTSARIRRELGLSGLLTVLLATGSAAEESAPALRLNAGVRDAVRSIAFSPDGRTLAAGTDGGKVHLWDLASGRARLRIEAARFRVNALAFSPDGKTLGTAADGTAVRLWDPATGTARPGPQPSDEAASLAFSPSAEILALGGQGQVRLWDLAKGRAFHDFALPGSRVGALAFSPDGKLLASGGWNDEGNHEPQLRLWDVAGLKALRSIHAHRRLTPRGWENRVSSVAFSPDGSILASGGEDGEVRLWEAATGKALRNADGHRAGVLSVAFSLDGKFLASGGFDGALRLWDAGALKPILAPAGPPPEEGMKPSRVLSVAFSPDGRRLAAGYGNGDILLWTPACLAARAEPGEIEALWKDLVTASCFEAVQALAASPERTVAFLKGRLRPARVDEGRIAALIAGLDADDFAERERATEALRALGALAEPALRTALAASPSPEVRERARELLEGLETASPLEGDALREVRAVQLLELIATPDARELLAALAAGSPGAAQTREAVAALGRLDARAASRQGK